MKTRILSFLCVCLQFSVCLFTVFCVFVYSFLTKTGLMKPAAPPPNCKPSEKMEDPPVSENGPTNEDPAAPDSCKMAQVEELR